MFSAPTAAILYISIEINTVIIMIIIIIISIIIIIIVDRSITQQYRLTNSVVVEHRNPHSHKGTCNLCGSPAWKHTHSHKGIQIGGDLAPTLGGTEKICCRPNFLIMTFFRKKFPFYRPKFLTTFFSHRLYLLSVFCLYSLKSYK